MNADVEDVVYAHKNVEKQQEYQNELRINGKGKGVGGELGSIRTAKTTPADQEENRDKAVKQRKSLRKE